jgi:uncharacterized OB-fold protein
MIKSPVHYSPYDMPMWESISARQMRLQRSPAGVFRYPPGPVCPESLSTEYEWVPISGRGTLLSWTVFHRKYLQAYPPPSLVIAVRLDEGPIMVSNMEVAEIPHLRIGAPVRMVYGEHPDGYVIPRFTLA